MKTVSFITRLLAWAVVIVLAVVVLACVAVYVPAVQQFAARRASAVVAEKTGVRVSVERFRLRFPLGVSLRGATLVMPSGDTLLTARRVTTNVAFSLRRLRGHDIRVRRLTIDGAFVRVPSSASADTLAARPSTDTLIPVLDWGLSVGVLRVSDSRLAVGGLDFREVAAQVRDVVYDRGEVSVDVRSMAFREAAHGVGLESASGGLFFRDGEYKIDDFSLKTAHSSLKLTASVGASIARLAPSTAISLETAGTISGKEFSSFFNQIPKFSNFQIAAAGTLARLTVSRLEIDAPGQARLTARGSVENMLAPALLSASGSLAAEVEDTSFARRFLPDTVRFGLPKALAVTVRGDFSAAAFDVERLAVKAGHTLGATQGTLDVRGRLDLKARTYAANLRAKDFPLGDFLPADSLGRATLFAAVRGRGFDPEGGIHARARARVQKFDWKTHDLHDVALTAEMDGEAFDIDLSSDNELLRTTLVARGALAKNRTEAAIRTGDLTLDFASPLPLMKLVEASAGIDKEVRRQLHARNFSADSLQGAFPEIRLTARAGRQNFVSEFARARGVDFADLRADVATTADVPFNIRARATRFVAGTVALDTIALDAGRSGAMLDYSLRMAGRRSPGDLVGDHLGLVVVDGDVGGNTLTVNLLQQNQKRQTGFRFGAVATLQDSLVHIKMTPLDPVLGYERWAVDGAGMGGDWLEIGLGGALKADLQLTGDAPGKYINLSSASLTDTPQALRLDAAGLDIAAGLELFPTMPQMFGGLFFSGATFGLLRQENQQNIVATGSVGVDDFTYSGRRIADVEAAVDFQTGASGAMELRAEMLLDGATSVSARGTYKGETMDFAVKVPGLPLALADGFVPPDFGARFSGALDGEVAIKGTAKDPQLKGSVGFTDAAARIGMTGTTLRISPERVTVDGRRVSFNDIGLVAPNNQKLTLGGGIDFTDQTHPRVDATIRGRNFQLVNSSHIGGSQLYGTAAFDANITARGPLQRLLIRGNINPTAKTDFVYIVRDNSRVQDRRQHIVEFRRFADDSLYAAAPPEEQFASLKPRVDMLVGMRMGDGLKATLSLDEQNENRVELIGGGDLTFSMNPQGDVRLSGRYELSGGTVYYRPPMIAQKVFAVERGSYVEWRGAAGAPEFHVSGTQKMEVEVIYDEAYSERVEFDVTVDISGTLGRMDMRFDLAAPGNLAIHNQLLSMDAEERMRQALGLLIYGQYTGPGVVAGRGASFDARKQLADFISREVNQWARNNLKGVDFSMGIDRRTDGVTGLAHTDYKYSVSKTMFSDRVKVSVGGRVSDERTEQSSMNNLLEDVSLEYRVNRRGTMMLRLYRNNTRVSILEGEVTETGGGFIMRKKVNTIGDIFRNRRRRERDE